MGLPDKSLMPATTAMTSPSGLAAPVRMPSTSARFAQIWAEVNPQVKSRNVTVQSGDTLTGLVKAHYRQQGLLVSENQAYRQALQVANANRIDNPNLIHPGQTVDFSPLNMPGLARGSHALDVPPPARQALQAWRTPEQGATQPLASAASSAGVLDRVLQRAVDKGFVDAQSVGRVRSKIESLAQRYNFDPDDFARMTLMESGGMNPRASNGHCHGIIQFCDGPNRGAATVGFKDNPRSILGMSLLQQLDLVDRFFAKAGLSAQGPKLGLDDLYLTVLTPAARSESRRDVPLNIAGTQASWLYVDRDTRKGITRNSLVAGLHAMSEVLLSPLGNRRPGARVYANAADTPPAP